MRTLLNTLYVQTDRAYIHLDHDTLKVEIERELKLQVPLLQVAGIVCLGNVMMSPALLHRCADDGRSVAMLDRNGRFKLRLEGPASGNVLLRRAQHLALSDPARRLPIVRNMVAGKLRNSRHVLLRARRDATDPGRMSSLGAAAALLGTTLTRLPDRPDIDALRGDEGDAAAKYFSVFDHMIRPELAGPDAFAMVRRTRRPPLDRTNATLSFLYTLLRIDCVAALEGVGLDPQVGFLHALRPGRPALALDLMEEFRPVVADRLALSLINRGQLGAADFEVQPGGAVYLNEDGRRTVITAYQKRKDEEVPHRVVGQPVPFGLIPHLQARLLARHLRNDLAHYPPYLAR